MDRFAFKIDKALKANLYKICRLCGIDNPDQVPILSETANNIVEVDVEPEISFKIRELIGFTVSKDDKMPQNICTICVDKINDFYEFRDMCYATNVQTRKLLGLKAEEPNKHYITALKSECCLKQESSTLLPKKARKRKSDEDADFVVKSEKNFTALHKKFKTQKQTLGKKASKISNLTKMEPLKLENAKVEIKEESSLESSMNKFRYPCSICDQRFVTKAKVEQHKRTSHIPNIPRYVCSTCDETYYRTSEIKTHQLWHKLSRTPYTCALCGECMLSSYVFTRHLREHCSQIPNTLLVLDRECPQCHQKYVTNFLFNIHACAVQTCKCPGCNRKLRNDEEYMRHAPLCSKVYLTHSRYIAKATDTTESFVSIKNENDVEAAAAAASMGMTFEMSPFVSLTRLSTPMAMSGNQCVAIPSEHSNSSDIAEQRTSTLLPGTKSKKSNKRGVTKEDIKRIDDLLKSTLDTLVSIKHEPEMHVDSDTARGISNEEGSNSNMAAPDDSNDENNSVYNDDHHNDDDDDEDAHEELNLNMNIKQEPTESHEMSQTQSIDKMPVLKLKIRKEHGTLNSSLVDEESGTAKRSEKKKKKKKHKDGERDKDKEQKSPSKAKHTAEQLTGVVRIKQEPNCDFMEHTSHVSTVPTVMTSIPMAQFQISAVASGVQLGEDVYNTIESSAEEPPDIKPNCLELNRLLNLQNEHHDIVDEMSNSKCTAAITLPQITCVSSLAALPAPDDMAHHNVTIKAEPVDSDYFDPIGSFNECVDPVNNVNKDAAGAEPKDDSLLGSDVNIEKEHSTIQRVQSAVKKPQRSRKQSIPNKICIDAEQTDDSVQRQEDAAEEEADYIRSIDFNNLQIKQEKEIDLYDVSHEYTPLPFHNGKSAKKRRYRNGNECAAEKNVDEQQLGRYEATECDAETDDYSCDSAEEDEAMGYEHINEEEREYREMELPPLLQQINNNNVSLTDCGNHMDTGYMSTTDVENNDENVALNLCKSHAPTPANGLLITNVCSQVHVPEAEAFKISDATAAYDKFKVPIKLEPLDADDCESMQKIRHVGSVTSANLINADAISVVPNVLGLMINPMSSTQRATQLNLHQNTTTANKTPASASTIHFNVTSDKESQLKAEPIVGTGSDDTLAGDSNVDQQDEEEEEEFVRSAVDDNGDAIEIQQNMVNAILDTRSESSINLGNGCDDDTPTTSTSRMNEKLGKDATSTATVLRAYNEEADNLINENLVAAMEQQEVQNAAIETENSPLTNDTSHANNTSNLALNNLLLDYNNINEIAENNNNANIERELHDDHVDIATDSNDVT